MGGEELLRWCCEAFAAVLTLVNNTTVCTPTTAATSQASLIKHVTTAHLLSMNAILQALEAKKRARQQAGAATPTNKYKRRAEVEAEQEQAQLQLHHNKQQRLADVAAAEEANDENQPNRSSNETATPSHATDDQPAAPPSIPYHEVLRRLRLMHQPITLFGETEHTRIERLKTFELALRERADGSSTQLGHNKEWMRIVEETANEVYSNNPNVAPANNVSDTAEDDIDRDIAAELAAAERDEQHELNGIAEFKDDQQHVQQQPALGSKHLRRTLDQLQRSNFTTSEDYILAYFKHLLAIWESRLNERTNDVKLSQAGKVQSATYKQTRTYIKPFLKLLKTRTVHPDILLNTGKIVDACVQRNYSTANAAYLLLAIGNAAWPMGVTMVGIHERANRERLHSNSVAHVLNDEITRRYIQSIKRLISYAADVYPSTSDNWIELKQIAEKKVLRPVDNESTPVS